MKKWLIKKLGGYTHHDLTDAVNRTQRASTKLGYEQGYTNGHKEGFAKGRKALQHTPGWLRKEVHRKLDLMFENDKFGSRARYRWLKQHSLTTSHMSKMSFDELQKVNKLLSETIGEFQEV